MKVLQQKAPKSVTKKRGQQNGSEFSSTRDSEERHPSVAAQNSRGTRVRRDYELEQVRLTLFYVLPL
jgi:mortality factor 4-like protein 1